MLANNLNFQAIEIFGGSLSSGQSLSLNPIGNTSTANLVLCPSPVDLTVAGRGRR